MFIGATHSGEELFLVASPLTVGFSGRACCFCHGVWRSSGRGHRSSEAVRRPGSRHARAAQAAGEGAVHELGAETSCTCYRGLDKIEGLHQWSWLEGNGLSKIEGLDQTPSSAICTKIASAGSRTSRRAGSRVQLSNNWVRKIENLSGLPRLSTLQLADNRLRDADDVRHLLSCPNVTVLDLQNNKLDDPALLGVLEAMPQLAVLQLQGNPLVGKVKQYRRTVISRCKSLTCLDDRPVFAEERLCVEAWLVGGLEAEREERRRQRDEKDAAHRRNLEYMKALMRGGRADTGTEESAEDASVNSERSALSPAAELPAASSDDMHARALRAIETKRAELLRKAEEGGGAK